MKITREQFEGALYAATQGNGIISGAHWPKFEAVSRSLLAALGIEVDDSCPNCAPLDAGASVTRTDGTEGNVSCSTCGAIDDEMVWVERTWIDVRQGDIVRPVQPPSRRDDETHAAIVEAIGPVNHWHASPNANEYRPNESPLEWSAIRVTLELLTGAPSFTPEHGMKPDAGVEIKVTRAELAAIEALGGWTERVGVLESGN